jgi:hypothetical protein
MSIRANGLVKVENDRLVSLSKLEQGELAIIKTGGSEVVGRYVLCCKNRIVDLSDNAGYWTKSSTFAKNVRARKLTPGEGISLRVE